MNHSWVICKETLRLLFNVVFKYVLNGKRGKKWFRCLNEGTQVLCLRDCGVIRCT